MAFIITWAHRHRTEQADQTIEWLAGSIGPEPGTSYALQVRDAADVLLVENLAIAGSTATVTTDNTGPLTFTLWSQRDGFDSWQRVVWTETQAAPDAGPGTAIDATAWTGPPTLPTQPHGEPLVADGISPPESITNEDATDFLFSD